MYYNDKIKKISLRLTNEEWEFVTALCDETGRTPSDMVRYCIDSVAHSFSIVRENLIGGASDGSDHKADIYNQL